MGLINNENAELIFSMHSMGGMSPEEIAGVLNISVDEVNAVINNTDYDGIDDENWNNEDGDEDEGVPREVAADHTRGEARAGRRYQHRRPDGKLPHVQQRDLSGVRSLL